MEYAWWIGVHSFLARADIAPWEVMEVLYSSRRWARAARTRDGLPVTTVWGRTEAGRALVVMLREQPVSQQVGEPGANGTWEILMAAQMRPHQLREYIAWEANR